MDDERPDRNSTTQRSVQRGGGWGGVGWLKGWPRRPNFVADKIPKHERDRVRQDLLDDCHRDTLAMVSLVETLEGLAWLPSQLIPHRHRPRAELQPAHELQVDRFR